MVNWKHVWQYSLLSTDLTFSESSVGGRHGQGHLSARIPSSFKVKGNEPTSNVTHCSGSCTLLWPLNTELVSQQTLWRMSPSQHSACTGIHGKIIRKTWTKFFSPGSLWGPWNLRLATNKTILFLRAHSLFFFFFHLERWWTVGQWTHSPVVLRIFLTLAFCSSGQPELPWCCCQPPS